MSDRGRLASGVHGRVLVFALAAATLASAPATTQADELRSFRFDARLEAPLLALGAAAWITSEALKPRLVPERCRWCQTGVLDARVHERLRWSRARAARRLSDVLLFGVVPAVAVSGAIALAARHGEPRGARVDAMVLGETVVLTACVTQLAKFAAVRQRPHDGMTSSSNPDDRLSFFSGHTSGTFALAVAAGMTATLRGYPKAAALWGVGLPLAALTGYLRLAGGRHYLTDVLVGALVGSAVGVLVPWLHARGQPSTP